MYELLILSMLASRDMSGYKLRVVLGNTLVPRRAISNGVMYPLLNKLAQDGYITLREETDGKRSKKIAHLTDAGLVRLKELMKAPIADDSKRESNFRFKLRGMEVLSREEQVEILADYEVATLEDLNAYRTSKKHLSERQDDPARPFLQWSIRSLELSISMCQAKLQWIGKQQMRLEKDITSNEK